jgi:hypothetical protein
MAMARMKRKPKNIKKAPRKAYLVDSYSVKKQSQTIQNI